MKIRAVQFEHLRQPLGIGTGTPRISWQVTDAPAAWRQTGYDIEIRDLDTTNAEPTVHSVETNEQILVPWPAAALNSRARAEVRVHVRGHADSSGGAEAAADTWSPPVVIEAGLLEPTDWSAHLLHPEPDASGPTPRPAMLLRTEIVLPEAPVRACWYVTAEGLYRGEINGRRVGDDELTPGWTSYRHRLRYRTYDVTAMLSAGTNALGAWLADGWFRGYVGFEGGVRDFYGPRTGLLAQLEVTYPDGSVEVFGTDDTWRSTTSPIVSTGLYEGESFDARTVPHGWSQPGHELPGWGRVTTSTIDPARLVAATGPAVRCTQELPVQEVIASPSGRIILDFGQNIAGRLRIHVRGGSSGDVVTLRHAEVLEHGELGTRPLRGAAATDTYTLSGGDEQLWEPAFTLHGFRYVQVDGWPGTFDPADVVARVIHTDLQPTGWWQSNDTLLNRLHENVRWSLRDNFVDIPTDCPQRDERLGWTADIAVFTPTAAYLYDCAGILTSWLADLAVEQADLGTVPVYVPYIPLSFPALPFAVWGDAAVTVPWDIYRASGDLDLLRQQYPSMLAWVEQVERRAGPSRRWTDDLQLGDWLDPAAPPDDPAKATTAPEIVATAYFAHSADLLAETAALLGEEADARRMRELAAAIRAAFTAEYVTPTGRMVSDSQTAYTLALCFDLLDDPAQRTRAGARLAQIVADGDFHIGTGFAGTALVCHALAAAGHLDEAYHLLLTDTCPSWLYPVTMGATTVWERWDSMLPDGSINPGDMTSFNHYALGAIADFLHQVVGGLAPTAPGYRTFTVAPQPGGGLSHCSTRHDTPYGTASVDWQRADGMLNVTIKVPVGTTALLTMPGPAGRRPPDPEPVMAGTHTFSAPFRAPEDDPNRPPSSTRLSRHWARP
jgi:alpha-L-rhamnosidase